MFPSLLSPNTSISPLIAHPLNLYHSLTPLFPLKPVQPERPPDRAGRQGDLPRIAVYAYAYTYRRLCRNHLGKSGFLRQCGTVGFKRKTSPFRAFFLRCVVHIQKGGFSTVRRKNPKNVHWQATENIYTGVCKHMDQPKGDERETNKGETREDSRMHPVNN